MKTWWCRENWPLAPCAERPPSLAHTAKDLAHKHEVTSKLYPIPYSPQTATLGHPLGLQVFTQATQKDSPQEETHTGSGNKLRAIWARNSETLGTQSMV